MAKLFFGRKSINHNLYKQNHQRSHVGRHHIKMFAKTSGNYSNSYCNINLSYFLWGGTPGEPKV